MGYRIEELEYYLKAPCGQFFGGGRPNLGSGMHSAHCRSCRQIHVWDLSHVGRLPSSKINIVKEGDLSSFAESRSSDSAPLEHLDAGLAQGRPVWCVMPTAITWGDVDGFVAAYDQRGLLEHLGRYTNGALERGLYMHQESGFLHYLSSRSSITYERGAMWAPDGARLLERYQWFLSQHDFAFWRDGLIKRMLRHAPICRRTTMNISAPLRDRDSSNS